MYIFGHLMVIFVCVFVFFGFFSRVIKKEEVNEIISPREIMQNINIDEHWRDLRLKEDFSKVMILEHGKINTNQNNKREVL